MLKPLTMSLGLAFALGLFGVSKAGGYDSNCSTCGLASPQGGVMASGQGGAAPCGAAPCNTGKKCHFTIKIPKLSCHLPKLCHQTSYEWVLKKKHNFSFAHQPKGCNTCASPVYGSGQGGAAPSAQAAGSPQIYGAGQHAYSAAKPATTIAAMPAEMTPAMGSEEVPPAPEVRETSASGLLLPTPSGN